MWIVARHLGRLEGPGRGSERARVRYVKWHLGVVAGRGGASKLDLAEDAARALADSVELMIADDGRDAALPVSSEALAGVFEEPVGRRLLAVNTYQDVQWFNRERFSELVGALCAAAAVRSVTADPADALEGLTRACDAARLLPAAAEASDFRVVEFLAGSDADAGTDAGQTTDRPERKD